MTTETKADTRPPWADEVADIVPADAWTVRDICGFDSHVATVSDNLHDGSDEFWEVDSRSVSLEIGDLDLSAGILSGSIPETIRCLAGAVDGFNKPIKEA
jgi:hypothetical protein